MATRSHCYGTFANLTGESSNPTGAPCVTTDYDTTAVKMAAIRDGYGDGNGPSKTVGAETDVALADAIQYEHELTFWQAAKLYPKAVGWSAFVSIGVIMLAFDPQIIGNMFAMPQFQKDFGFELDGEVCTIAM